MARVRPYERVVDAVLIHTSSAFDTEIQNGMKIKEEPIDTTWNTDTTEDCTTRLVRSYSLIDHNYHQYRDKLSSPKADILYKDTDNIGNSHLSNNDSAQSNNVNKTVNVDRKSVKVETRNTLERKKRTCSNKVSNNKIDILPSTTERVIRKRKRQKSTLGFKTKRRRTNKSVKEEEFVECDICFKQFPSLRNCEFHKIYYENNDMYICKRCTAYFATKKELQNHMRSYRCSTNNKYNCNFCNRSFSVKILLQSHLFHAHSELIYFNNINCETISSKNINTSPEDDTLRTDVNRKSCSNNLKKNLKSEETNTTFINNIDKSWDNNEIDIKKSENEKLLKNEISPTRKLRQPTLTEYLEFCKKKRDIKLSPNNDQIGSSTKSDNLPKQMAQSILEQTTKKHEICSSKKPFVRLHADVEIMKSFLEKLSDIVVKDKVSEDRVSDSLSYDREVPYSLRSLSAVSSMEAGLSSGMTQNKNVSKKSPVIIEFSSKEEQNIDENKIDPKVDRKIIMADFKCKECTIPLTRYDERPKNSYQISTIDTIENTSLTTQCNSTLFQESDIRNKVILKDLEVSLERLTPIPIITTIKTELNIETNINYFLCQVCNKSFSSKLNRRIHIKSSHVAYMSSICNARYTLKHKLLQHYLCEHLFKENQCCICYILLPDYEALKQHLNIHCLRYIRKEDDQCTIDIELKCKNSYKCLHCNKTFSSQSCLEVHQSYCTVQEEMEKNQEDFMEEVNICPQDAPEIQHKKNTDEITCDERINLDDLCDPLNSDSIEKKSNEHQILLQNEKQPEINEVNRNFPVNNLIEKKIENIKESQNSRKLLKNKNSTINNQNIVNTQLDDTTVKTMTYPCEICGKQFHNPKNLEIHIRTFSFTTDICPMCGTGFSSQRLLRTHITSAHVPQISKTYSFHCVFCNQGFFKKHDLRPHILHLHGQQVLNTLTRNLNGSQEESDPLSIVHTAICNICNLVFETHDRYVEHRMYYYKNHTFTCTLCAQNFQGMYMFHHHNKLTHYSENKRKSYSYICDICNEGFNHESHFYSHHMHVHSNEVNLTETGKELEKSNHSGSSDVQETNSGKNLSTDQQTQNEQLFDKYTCDVCQLECIDMNHMTMHKEFYSNDGDFRCDKCNRRCRTFYLLNQHRKLTHLYRDVYNGCACHICDEVLESLVRLKCHEKHFHSNITNNNMDNCNQISSSNVTYNIMEQPYKSNNNACNGTEYNCLFCNMKFLSANAAQTHIVHVHMDDMIAKRTILKLGLPIVNNVDIQKQFAETDLTVPSSSISSSSSESNSTQLSQSSIQQSNILHNSKYEITNKNNIELLKKFRINPKNKIIRKILFPAISLINKPKDISTFNTIAPNMELKADISTSLSIGSIRTVTSNVEFRNNTLGLQAAKPTISKAIISNTESKNNTSILSSGSTNNLQKSYGIRLKSGSINEPKANSISSSNSSATINKSKTAPIVPLSTGSLSILKGTMPQNWKSYEIINQKSESVSSEHSYSCPLCPLEYPSLMFFHAHLKYAHASSIRTNEQIIRDLQVNQPQTAPVIECLLCPCNFIDETKYKKHLRNSHTYYVYIPSSQEMTKVNNVPLTTQTNINKKNIISETITVEDDDDDNVKNISDQRTTEVTSEVTPNHKEQNEKIGKLRVKPFAKIIENLSKNSGLKL